LTNRPHAPRLALALTLTATLSVLGTALLGPAQTLAQTRRAACSTGAHAKSRHAGAHACAQSSHKLKAGKRHGKHSSTKKTSRTGSPGSQAVAALCQDGSAPVRGGDGSFSCADGSEPTCEDGATPTSTRNGKSLLCPAASEGEPASVETECEEESLGCATETSSGSGEQACEASASASSSFVCEDES